MVLKEDKLRVVSDLRNEALRRILSILPLWTMTPHLEFITNDSSVARENYVSARCGIGSRKLTHNFYDLPSSMTNLMSRLVNPAQQE
ncbi:MAG: hypothetical protein A4E19_00800 [Nitrospira sp. SG-bin1]|nr:MAG: hypothetical protein A4E19_00800 [Nitrospira sp. SG-bin1]